MKDPEGVLMMQGENAQNPDMIRFTENRQVVQMQQIVKDYLREAMDYAEEGRKPPKVKREFELPDELAEAMDTDPELAEAFHALTPGRQMSYVLNLKGAKKPETRVARIAKFRDKILEGKGALER